mgnify:FL=1
MDTLYRKLDLIEQLNLSVGTIDNHMKKGSLKFLKIGKAVRFRDADIDEWVKRHYPIKHIGKNTTTEQVNGIKKVFGGIHE